ncbi:Mucin-associated surface protein (MASP) [Trypanosoma cruzi]|uniref:Mucin-associated surface protein (MASP), putative n=2 Tax=Trypanosoma cruzi TaxID=5693 RepID=Q4CZA8_TRYCC|nr:mucin-associated surface protein (MASP), putative [Trypanosoma cruzi]EAN85609.1 mucin-associated surface protein (MASP), putative [Trypanosoma cruzi]PWV20620.1 Mucin-associated surface protein (MASP) [Trypanosoma cruzi]|eukprot:XP_807460.1 mucin-associated surface protein (MASP) [Trypanosoma cruzi strain CL Brener]
MMMTGRVLLVCALCVLWCGAGRVYARNPDNNSLGGCIASGGFGRKKSFLSNGSIKNLSTPLLLSASFISAIQAEAREEVPSAGVTNLPLSGSTGLSPAFSDLGTSSPRPTVPVPGADVSAHVPAIPGRVPATPGPAGHGHGPVGPGLRAAIPGVDVPSDGPGAIPAVSGVRAADAPTPGVAVRSDGAAAFSGLGAAGLGAAGPGPLRDPAFPGPDANIRGSVAPGHGTPITGAAGPGAAAFSSLGAAIHDAADPGAAIPGAIPGPSSVRGAAVHGPAGPSDGPAGTDHVPAFSGLVPAGPGAGHSVGGGSKPPDSRSVVISSSQGGNGKTAPVSVLSDEQIASPKEVLAQKETGSEGTSSPEGQPTVSSNNEKQRNNSASAGGHSLGHDAAGDELQDSLEEQKKNDHSQTNETKKSSGDQNTESQSSGGALSEVSNTTTHGIKTQQPKTNSANEKNYSQNTDASHTTSPLLLLFVVACAAAAAVVAA